MELFLDECSLSLREQRIFWLRFLQYPTKLSPGRHCVLNNLWLADKIELGDDHRVR